MSEAPRRLRESAPRGEPGVPEVLVRVIGILPDEAGKLTRLSVSTGEGREPFTIEVPSAERYGPGFELWFKRTRANLMTGVETGTVDPASVAYFANPPDPDLTRREREQRLAEVLARGKGVLAAPAPQEKAARSALLDERARRAFSVDPAPSVEAVIPDEPAPPEEAPDALILDETVTPPGETLEKGPVPEHVVGFIKEKGRFVVTVASEEYTLINARETYLLPGDTVAVSLLDDHKARAETVEYGIPRTVAGRVETEPRTGEYVFVARIPAPPPNRTLNKIKFPIDALENAPGFSAEEALESGKIFLFNRDAAQRGAIPLPKAFHTEYQAESWMTLVNLGVLEYDPAAEALAEGEQEAALELALRYGVSDLSKREEIDALAEPTLKEAADREAAEGAIEDFRGEGITVTIDPAGSRDHDDAFSVEKLPPSPEGHERYRLGLHFSDASRLIEAGSVLDEAAMYRGTSIYTDDDTVRMLPSVVSEHLGSLKAGMTRFAFSVAMDVTFDSSGVRISDFTITPSAVRVDRNLTYREAGKALEPSRTEPDAVTTAVHVLKRIADGLHARIGIRQPGNEPSEKLDAFGMVEIYNQMMNRIAGVALDRLSRASGSEERPRLAHAQGIVSGLYRMHQPAPERKAAFLKELKDMGVLAPGEAGEGNFDALVRRSRRAIAGMPEKLQERYYQAAFRAMRGGETGYAQEPTGQFSMGGILMSRVSSPLRRSTDLVGQRMLKYLLSVDQIRRTEGGDISEEQERSLLLRYARDVFGLDLAPEAQGKDADAVFELVHERTEERLSGILASATSREQLGRRAEGAAATLKATHEIARDVPVACPPPYGLAIEVESSRSRGADAQKVYGQVTISQKENRKLAPYLSERVERRGITLQVEYALPEGAEDPVEWCKAQGLSRCTINLAGAIVGADVSKGRLIFEVDAKQGDTGYLRPLPQGRGRGRPQNRSERKAGGVTVTGLDEQGRNDLSGRIPPSAPPATEDEARRAQTAARRFKAAQTNRKTHQPKRRRP